MPSAIRKATVPMMGGVTCPPEEATVSTAPASSGLYPIFFIRGMVRVPVVTTFATVLPEIMAMQPLLRTATLAGPPGLCPARERAMSIKRLSPPVSCRKTPKEIKTNRVPAQMEVMDPKKPSVVR